MMSITRQQAWDLLTKYNEEPFHLRHAITVEHVMGWFSQELGYGQEKEFWSLVGLLHDLDLNAGRRSTASKARSCAGGWSRGAHHPRDSEPRLGNAGGDQT